MRSTFKKIYYITKLLNNIDLALLYKSEGKINRYSIENFSNKKLSAYL